MSFVKNIISAVAPSILSQHTTSFWYLSYAGEADVDDIWIWDQFAINYIKIPLFVKGNHIRVDLEVKTSFQETPPLPIYI